VPATGSPIRAVSDPTAPNAPTYTSATLSGTTVTHAVKQAGGNARSVQLFRTNGFGKVFADAGAVIREGLDAYVRDVSDRSFPQPEHWFPMKDDEYDELVRLLDVDTEEADGAGG
jgi:hypothetical protein